MASARPIMEVPAPPQQTGVELQLSVEEARVLRCMLGSAKNIARTMQDFVDNGCSSDFREEYLEVAGKDVAYISNHILGRIKDALPSQYSGR